MACKSQAPFPRFLGFIHYRFSIWMFNIHSVSQKKISNHRRKMSVLIKNGQTKFVKNCNATSGKCWPLCAHWQKMTIFTVTKFLCISRKSIIHIFTWLSQMLIWILLGHGFYAHLLKTCIFHYMNTPWKF